MSRESPIVEILQFIAARPDGLPTRGADIPGLDAARGRACIEWLTDRGLIDASIIHDECIVRGIIKYGTLMLARASAAQQ